MASPYTRPNLVLAMNNQPETYDPLAAILGRAQAPVLPQEPAPQPEVTKVNPQQVETFKNLLATGQLQPKSMTVTNKGPEAIDSMERFKQIMEQRAGGIKGMQTQLDTLNNKQYDTFQNLDLSPLAALVDSETGSKLSQGYKAPGQRTTDQATAQKLAEAIRGQQDKLSDDELGYLKSQDQTKMQLAQMGMLAGAGARDRRFDQSQTTKFAETIRKDIDAKSKPLYEAVQQTDALEAAVASNDLTRLEQTIGNFARNVGGNVGALSDGDIARQLPPSFAISVEKAKRYIDAGNEIPPEIKATIIGGIKDFKLAVNRTYQSKLEATRQDFKEQAQIVGIPQMSDYTDSVVNRKIESINGGLGQLKQGGQQQAPAAAKTPAERYAELKAKKGL